MIRVNEYPVPNLIFPQNVLVSTFFKDKLSILIECILSANPEAMFYSTGGTGKELQRLMGKRAKTNYMSVEEFTGCPEMQGGLVKTLHPKNFAGLLAERNNPEHERYLADEMSKFGKGPGVYFDVFAGNLYPFEEAVQQDGGSAEVARCYIDIGGPSIIMAAAKNWHSVTTLTHPEMYENLRNTLRANNGKIPAAARFNFAVKAMAVIKQFRTDNYNYFSSLDFKEDVLPTISLAA